MVTLIHEPACTHCGQHDGEIDNGKCRSCGADIPDCEDCGVVAGNEHSPKCNAYKEHYADLAYEAHKEERRSA